MLCGWRNKAPQQRDENTLFVLGDSSGRGLWGGGYAGSAHTLTSPGSAHTLTSPGCGAPRAITSPWQSQGAAHPGLHQPPGRPQVRPSL